MATTTLRRDEGAGLALAVAAHVALVAALVWRPIGEPVVAPPERMTVTIADEVGLTSTSPEPAARAAPDAGPAIGEPAPPEPVAKPEPPQPITKPEPPKPKPEPQQRKPQPAPRAAPPPPRPVARPVPPRSAPRAALAPKPAQPRPQPRPQPAARPAARPAQARPAQARPAATAPRNAGASSFADAFKTGLPGAQASGQSRNPPASSYSPATRASFAQSVMSQVKPNWQGRVPQGVNTEKLETFLSVELNRDGTLARRPIVIRQAGVDDSNRAQAGRHAEEAIKAVQLSEPFKLPADQFEGWQKLPPLRFRK